MVFAGYFFIANGGTVPNAESVRLLAFNLDDTYSYYVKVQFSSATVDSAEELVEIVGSMLTVMLPEFMLRLPDWVDVREGRYPASAKRSSEDNKAARVLGVEGSAGRVRTTERG